ncbi:MULTISPECIES: lysine exporter LysO family protein [unclassified Moritella]|uniref:lysine exporter LysO family protein n=1 Tax=unclassified Moritella TaxID=2637987 RepID=UPI001BA68315|nr:MULTISPECIES: lysine exporter LysO family protein [unclassified Moritella]QUM83442.1 lysine exporter LysO family protein [Moritella sp. 28]QUM87748.1 lysine exporter LysO family protein [Moritella sp. 36]
MYSGFLIVIIPLVLGYLVELKQAKHIHWINVCTNKMIYVILFLMGISLSHLDNFSQNIQNIGLYSFTVLSCVSIANLMALWGLDKRLTKTIAGEGESLSKWHLILESLQLICVIAAGFILGLFVSSELIEIDAISEGALVLLLLFIGCQLRNSGMQLREILLNTWGIKIAVVMILSSWVGGLAAALLLEIPLTNGLALASGFGWYSLSGILITDGLSPVFGGAAFIIDLGRELVAILIIPSLIRLYPSTAIGYAGATAMDFTLPMIQKSGGNGYVPLAIVSGFILSLSSPLFISVFLAL